jgi:hypothetical protein
MFYMKDKLEKLTTIRVLLHNTFCEYWSKIFAISMHAIFGFVSTSSIICDLELENCRHFVPMPETLFDTTQQQMQ